jgi:type II secretory pathway pseudopilin PulG
MNFQENLSQSRSRRSHRVGTSLLELVLALVVAMVILSLAMGVIQMQGRLQKAHFAKAERMQLARAVLKHVAGDLRHAMSTVEFDATGISTLPDVSTLMSMSNSSSTGLPTGATGAPMTGSPTGTSGATNSSGASSSSARASSATGAGTPGPTNPQAYQLYGGGPGTSNVGAGGGGGGTSPTPTNGTAGPAGASQASMGTASIPSGGSLGGGAAPSSASAATGTSTEPTASGLGSDVVKIYFRGTADRLEFDASRLPRIDEYEGFGFDNGSGSSDASVTDITSDVKTVTYYVGSLEDIAEMADMSFGEQEFSAEDGDDEEPETGLIRSEVDRSASLYATLEAQSTQLDRAEEVVAPEVSSVVFRYFDGTEWWDEWDSDELGGIPTAVEIDLTLRGESEDSEGDHYLLVVRLPASQRVALEEAELAKQQAETMPATDATTAGAQGTGTAATSTPTGSASNMMGAPAFGAQGGTGAQGGFGAPFPQGQGGGQGPGGPGGNGQGPGGRGGRGGGQGGGRAGGGGGFQGGGGGGRGGAGGFGGGGFGGGGMGGGGARGGGGMGGGGMGGGAPGGFGGARGGGS